MRRVALRDFAENPMKFLEGSEQVAVEQYGEPIGYYFPVAEERRDPEEEAARRKRLDESIARLETTIQKILDETGMTEDELADLFDPNKPLPEHPIRRNRPAAVLEHGSRD
jgi:hypothetical protein